MILVLIGYRGSGKTSVARQLALRLGWTLVDSDEEVELRAGKSIKAIFDEDGEEAFRQLESDVVADLCRRDRVVLGLGGGAVVREENRRCLQGDSKIVWLQAEPETIFQRISGDATTAQRRPDLTETGGLAEIRQLLAQRTPIYQQCADLVVDTERKDPAAVADEILSALRFSPEGSD